MHCCKKRNVQEPVEQGKCAKKIPRVELRSAKNQTTTGFKLLLSIIKYADLGEHGS